MTDELNLSDRIKSLKGRENVWIHQEDVKEFIKRLKDYFVLHQKEYRLEQLGMIMQEINSLAGDKLK